MDPDLRVGGRPRDPGRASGSTRPRSGTRSLKCEEYGIDVWVIDHLLSAPGLYGNAWLEPLGVLSYAAALTARVKLGTGSWCCPSGTP